MVAPECEGERAAGLPALEVRAELAEQVRRAAKEVSSRPAQPERPAFPPARVVELLLAVLGKGVAQTQLQPPPAAA